MICRSFLSSADLLEFLRGKPLSRNVRWRGNRCARNDSKLQNVFPFANEREDAGVSSLDDAKNGASPTASVFSSCRFSASPGLYRRRSPKDKTELSRIEGATDLSTFDVCGVHNILAFLAYRVQCGLFAFLGGYYARNIIR